MNLLENVHIAPNETDDGRWRWIDVFHAVSDEGFMVELIIIPSASTVGIVLV